jgi:hypothetical protein
MKNKSKINVADKFGRLTIVNAAPPTFYGKARWLCLCECGAKKIVRAAAILCGDTRSCGCWHDESTSKRFLKHGETIGQKTYMYRARGNMIDRCHNVNNRHHKYYGGRGISVHKPWRDSVMSWLDYIHNVLGPRPSPQHSIDRINNNGNYEPGNIRWATKKEQAHNTRQRLITVTGKAI